ncbi:MAG TPA: hypothetical protein VMT52_13035, partial [Planctomycetota bacterium]|nr:hypothetical protein [Planctomycetota bacterium]
DGVNRHGAAHPELGALDAEGKSAVTGGIHSLGRGLCPSKAASRDFMLAYCRELFDDFYPGADGFFLEHSDYGTCRCAECGTGVNGLRREWEFVLDLSAHVWKKKPEALMMIYPQYTRLGVEYDSRFVVFLAPHNMAGAEKVRNPKVLWTGYWDCGAFFRDLCRTAAKAGHAGVIPSMENFNHENPHAFDTRWGPPGAAGWDDLLVRVTRLSFREFAARADLDDDGFRIAVRSAFFDPDTPDSAVEDLLVLHRHLNRWDGWTWRGGVVKAPASPPDTEKKNTAKKDVDLKARERLEREIIPVLEELKAIRERSAAIAGGSPATPGKRTLARMAEIAGWVLERWEGKIPR